MGYKNCLTGFQPIDLQEMRPPGFLDRITHLIELKHSKVAKKQGWKNVAACPLCSSPERAPEFSKFGIEIVCCEKCTLRYSSQIPVCTEDVYSDESYLPAAIESYMENVAYRKSRFGRERVDLIVQHIGNPAGKSLLDIGCGTGWFLEVARERGFEIFGQELGKELAQWTGERLGIEIFEEIPTDARFDAITMFDVIEHVPDPLQLILDCKKVLSRGGIIVGIAPNFDSLCVHLMKERATLIIPAEHPTYFTKKAIEILAKKVNLNLIFFKTCGIDLGDMKSYYESEGDHDTALACEKLYTFIQPAVDAAGAGNYLRFILQV